MRMYKEMFKNAVVVPSPATDRIGEAAKRADAYVVMGVNEKGAETYGTLYNTAVFFGPNGEIQGKRRKLVPTAYERLVHAGGDGSTLDVFDTPYGGLSALLCGENVNALARFSLLAKGEVIHAAMWPAFPLAQHKSTVEGMFIRIKAHAYEGKIFVLSSSGIVSDEMMDAMELNEAARKLIVNDGGNSTILNPMGRSIVDSVRGETVLYAELNMDEVIAGKYMHDVTGHYNRFDVFTLNVNRHTNYSLVETCESEWTDPTADLEKLEGEEEG
jgi:aliphatic nitrilase